MKGELVVLEFPFSNLMQIKRRPALIIKVPAGEDILVCQITGKSYEKAVEISLKNGELQEGSLKVDSQIRIDKIFSIEKSLIKYKIGRVKKEKFEQIINKICEFLKS